MQFTSRLHRSAASWRASRSRSCGTAARANKRAAPKSTPKRKPAPVQTAPTAVEDDDSDSDNDPIFQDDESFEDKSTLSQYLELGALLGQEPEETVQQAKMRDGMLPLGTLVSIAQGSSICAWFTRASAPYCELHAHSMHASNVQSRPCAATHQHLV